MCLCLIGYILVSHVLSFTGVTAAHLFLDQHGTFFVKNPTSVFGVDAAVYLGASSETQDPKSKYVYYFMGAFLLCGVCFESRLHYHIVNVVWCCREFRMARHF